MRVFKHMVAVVTTTLMASMMSLAFAQDKVVHVYNWSDYIDESILEDFERDTGIKVVYDVFDSNEVLETKLLAGGTGYDVVVPSASFMARQIQAGVFQKLDRTKLPNARHLWDDIAQRTAIYDPGNAYSVNYMWGTTGIGYNVDEIKARMENAPVDSWDLIFKPEIIAKFADCGIYVLDAPSELIPVVLLYLGFDPNSLDRSEMEKAQELLLEIRPHIQKFNSSDYINALANGDICLAIGWSGDVLQARDRADEAGNGVTIAYTIPREGTTIWFDQMAIPADAPNPDLAHQFINYIMDPQVIARASNYVQFANGNWSSLEHIDEEVIMNKGVFPDEETMGKLFVHRTWPPNVQRIATRIWTRVKSGT